MTAEQFVYSAAEAAPSVTIADAIPDAALEVGRREMSAGSDCPVSPISYAASVSALIAELRSLDWELSAPSPSEPLGEHR